MTDNNLQQQIDELTARLEQITLDRDRTRGELAIAWQQRDEARDENAQLRCRERYRSQAGTGLIPTSQASRRCHQHQQSASTASAWLPAEVSGSPVPPSASTVLPSLPGSQPTLTGSGSWQPAGDTPRGSRESATAASGGSSSTPLPCSAWSWHWLYRS